MRILITDVMHESIVPLLEAAGYQADYQPEISRKGIEEIIGGYEGIIIRSKTNLDESLLDKAGRLKFIGRAGAGLDKVDLDYVQKRGVQLFHAPEGNRDAVGEQAIGMLLSLFNHIPKADGEVRKGIWDREGNRGEELSGKTVGIFGYGNMGQALAKKLKGFGVKVLAYDKYKMSYGDEYAQEAKFEQIQQEADILSVHVPLTAETKGYFTMDILEGFKKPFYLINTARGKVVSMAVLNQALGRGILKGAVLDVLENEKLHTFTADEKDNFQELIARSNVIFSPHVAGWTFQSYEKINKVLVGKIKARFPG
ncbi:NAD(P)-dependent oxidoreductase [Echinicola jeungdonensis]|uniref:NAD(P)-dependent oxidoreductase n=1 Tax=Echinicola jeungdonensis TaxID=709343 RepID=A0ABV5J6B0_9BACT|nr:NAD(P)-dependent oxidoreductase [Echinicola jeungdonensis]MDN3669854.1 NAD(P)-dependent oxidoreductase [Echinicola jeungdonensis]